MLNAASLLTLILFATTLARAQSLQDLKAQYDQVSPLPKERIETKETIDPAATDKSPAEEQLAEIKEKQIEKQTELEEAKYLDTDFRFFQTLHIGLALEEDDLDKAYQQLQSGPKPQDLSSSEKIVKTELGTTAPQTALMTPQEAASADQHRDLILKKIAANVKVVRSCIVQNRKPNEAFKGTELTLAWEVDPTGKVTNAEVKVSDVENVEIKACILKSVADLDFSDITKESKKTSHIEYTYRFNSEAGKNKDLAAK